MSYNNFGLRLYPIGSSYGIDHYLNDDKENSEEFINLRCKFSKPNFMQNSKTSVRFLDLTKNEKVERLIKDNEEFSITFRSYSDNKEVEEIQQFNKRNNSLGRLKYIGELLHSTLSTKVYFVVENYYPPQKIFSKLYEMSIREERLPLFIQLIINTVDRKDTDSRLIDFSNENFIGVKQIFIRWDEYNKIHNSGDDN